MKKGIILLSLTICLAFGCMGIASARPVDIVNKTGTVWVGIYANNGNGWTGNMVSGVVHHNHYVTLDLPGTHSKYYNFIIKEVCADGSHIDKTLTNWDLSNTGRLIIN